MFAALEGPLSGDLIALFGFYDQGGGQRVQDWCARYDNARANLLDGNGLIVNEVPAVAVEEACKQLGRRLEAWKDLFDGCRLSYGKGPASMSGDPSGATPGNGA